MEETTTLEKFGRYRLLEYADSFRELADSFQGETIRREKRIEDISTEERKELLLRAKQRVQRTIFVEQLKEIASVVRGIANETWELERIDERRTRQLLRMLRSEGIELTSITVMGKKQCRRICSVQLRSLKKQMISIEDIAGYLSVFFDIRWIPWKNRIFYVGSQEDYYLFCEEPKFHVMSGVAKATKEQEQISGDSYRLIDKAGEMAATILSDGMGSGKRAEEISELAVDTMERFLEAGFSPEAAIQMLNGLLITDSSIPCTATMDFSRIDLYSGICELYKSGSAASFLKRDHMVEQISAHNLPLGLASEAEIQCKNCTMEDGDYLIQMSDGVFEAMHRGIGEGALIEWISKIQAKNPGEVSNQILRFVLQQCNGKIWDDMTVIVTGLWEKNREHKYTVSDD